MPALFRAFTGLTPSIAWAPASPGGWSTQDLPLPSRLCRWFVDGKGRLRARCRSCVARHLALTLNAGHASHRFKCGLGVYNSWLPIIIRGRIVALALFQAVAPCATGSAAHRPYRANRRMSSAAFSNAAELFQLVFRHVETAVLADLRKSDLTQAQRALAELQTVATRLREELNGLVPAFNKTTPTLERENHTGRLVSAVLECIHQRYSQPITLARCAQELRLNAAYLSALFSSHVGMPFKTYLTKLRIEKARDLLGEPTRSIADVAYAVGYASENRFRTAFKHVTGLSPRLWRETLRMKSDSTT